MHGHANCVRFVKSFGLPTLVVGGGGYTMRNVSRTWTYETGILNNKIVGPEIPYNDYYEYYGPDYRLEVRPSNMQNANSREYLNKILTQVLQNLSRTKFAPSVQIQDIPRDAEDLGDEEEDTEMAKETREARFKTGMSMLRPRASFTMRRILLVARAEEKSITVMMSDWKRCGNTGDLFGVG